MSYRAVLPFLLSVPISIAVACSSSSSTSTPTDGGTGPGQDGGAEGGGGDDAGAGADGGGDSGCHVQADCPGSFCNGVTLPPLCAGVCDDGAGAATCLDDSQCAGGGAAQICDSDLCSCARPGTHPPLHCRKGCTIGADCGTGLTCDATHRCVPSPCSGPLSCQSRNFACNMGFCAAATCMHDSDCANHCVNGVCTATRGSCQ
jgi:hypothetical protein